MTLGISDRQANPFDEVERFCDKVLDEASIYAFMHRERDRLFADEEFADLFDVHGRRSVPPSVVALNRVRGHLATAVVIDDAADDHARTACQAVQPASRLDAARAFSLVSRRGRCVAGGYASSSGVSQSTPP